jgi:hypothetical protein
VAAGPAHPDVVAESVRSTAKRNVFIGVGAGVVIVGVVLALVLSSGDDKKGKPAAKLLASQTTGVPSAGSPSPTTPVAALRMAKDFTGTYHYVEVVTASQGVRASDPLGKVGAKFVRTWTVVASCAGARCGASVTSSSGAKLHFEQQGAAWRAVLKGPADCRANDTGKLVGTTEHTVVDVLHPVAGAPGSLPRTFTGTDLETGAPAFTCPAVRVVGSIVMTRTG